MQILCGEDMERKRDFRIGKRVATDPSGIMPLSEEYPFGTKCHMAEIGTEGTFGRIVFIPLNKAVKTVDSCR